MALETQALIEITYRLESEGTKSDRAEWIPLKKCTDLG